jgi:hypothetical protein
VPFKIHRQKKFPGVLNFYPLHWIMQQKVFPIAGTFFIWEKHPLLKEIVLNKILCGK